VSAREDKCPIRAAPMRRRRLWQLQQVLASRRPHTHARTRGTAAVCHQLRSTAAIRSQRLDRRAEPCALSISVDIDLVMRCWTVQRSCPNKSYENLVTFSPSPRISVPAKLVTNGTNFTC